MGAGHFVEQAKRSGGMQNWRGWPKTHCCCHPPQWGLKKGLRRGRRRLDKLIISQEMRQLQKIGV
jgi:hypothetical protein